MALPALLAPLVGWIFRDVVVNFVVFAVIVAVISVFFPIIGKWLLPFVSSTTLSDYLNVLPPGVWYFLDLFRINYGIPLIISAYITRFMIRRLPVVG